MHVRGEQLNKLLACQFRQGAISLLTSDSAWVCLIIAVLTADLLLYTQRVGMYRI